MQSAIGAGLDSSVLAGTVTRVVDGDTLDVLLSSGRIRVRLHGIDAPESNQSGGAASMAWLAGVIQGQAVQITPVSQDQYDRLVAVVHLGSRDINRAMIAAGHAWAYRHYLRRSERDFCAMETRARASRLGLWKGAVPRAPWEHRATLGKGPFTDFRNRTIADCLRAIRRP